MSGGDSFNESKFLLQPATTIDLLILLYEEGIATKRVAKHTLAAGYMHRSPAPYLFGNPTGARSYRIHGTTHGMSSAELYVTWRGSVLDALRRPDVPKYLMLKFTTTSEVLLERCLEGISPDLQCKKALANIGQALDVLLGIIKDISPPTAPLPVTQAHAPPPVVSPSYHLWADMEGRRLVIHAGTHTLVSKHRLAYNGNPHKLLKNMVSRKGQELTKEQAGLPANLKMSNVVQGIGFKGLIHRKLLDSGMNTVMLREGVLINDHELREILESCQESFDTQ